MDKLQRVKNLLPYFQIADKEAKLSPCERRQYGCVIVWESPEIDNYTVGANYRESNCCKGYCARNRFNTFHGGRVEIGAEIHAETSALIRYKGDAKADNASLVLVGWIKDKKLKGKDVYPCHTCALNIKFAGFRYVYVQDLDDTIIPVSIAEIIERREIEWEPA
jgi:deoxycytidylate deaminase